MQAAPVTGLTVHLGERKLALAGRKAWALAALIDAGLAGLTTLDMAPGLRWSHYVWLLRRDGFVIESYPETHGGPFAGHHSRYILKSLVTEIARQRQGERRAAA